MEKNITVNCVSPGFIISDMTAKISEEHTDLMKSGYLLINLVIQRMLLIQLPF